MCFLGHSLLLSISGLGLGQDGIKMNCFLNDKTSLTYQLLISYSIITALIVGLTLGICYGLIYGLQAQASDSATSRLLSQTNSNAEFLATSISSAIAEQLNLVGNSICMVSTLYASILIESADFRHPILKEVIVLFIVIFA